MIGVDKIPDLTKRDLLPESPVASEADLFTYSEEQRWYYFSDMTEKEILVFKLFDSEHYEGRRCPHCAFANKREDAKPRESVEIRSVVYFK
jgi:hypothetical protein